MIQVEECLVSTSLGVLTLRNAEFDDFPQCLALLTSEFNCNPGRIKEYADRFAVGDAVVAVCGGEVLGVLLATEHSKMYNGAEMEYGAVKEGYRGAGIMGKLFDAVLQEVQNLPVYVCVWHRNQDEIYAGQVIEHRDFHEVWGYEHRHAFLHESDSFCCYCPHKGGVDCVCGSDLYRREAQKS